MARARNLRLFVHSPHENRNTSVRYAPLVHFNLMVVFFLSFRQEPITSLHFAATCRQPESAPPPPRVAGYSWKFLMGVCRPVLQILTLFQTKKCHFLHPISDQTSKIRNRFQIWPLGRNYVIITQIRAQTKNFCKCIWNSPISISFLFICN